MELKTLKDFCCEDGDLFFLDDIKLIKAEAIKWYHRSDGNKHKFIKHFFNITDEDLEVKT